MLAPLTKYGEKNIVIAVFCYNYAERYIKKGKQIYYWGNSNTSDRENKKRKKDNGTNCPVKNRSLRLTFF